MKLLFALALLIAPFTALSQNYVAPKPYSIVTMDSLNDAENWSLAWMKQPGESLVAQTFSKIEIGVSLPRSIHEKVEAFFNESVRANIRLNPFNRNDLSIEASFSKDDKLMHVSHAFYYEEYIQDLEHNSWIRDTSAYNFRIRFAPGEVGKYSARIAIKSKGEKTFYKEFEFEVEHSTNPGYLEIGSNGKHMRFSGTKESFVGVGQEIPWPYWEDWFHMEKPIGPKTVQPIHTALAKFDEGGGNYTRFVAAPWFMLLEWEALGNYQPRLGQAWEFDRMIDYCEEKEIYFMFCALLHTPLQSRSDKDADLFPGVRWETYCYNDEDRFPAEIAHERPIGIDKAIEYYSNPIANDHAKNYFRYLVSRYGYSTSLAGWQVMSEIDETAEYRDIETKDSTLDRSENRLHVRNWVNAMSTYMRDDLMDQHLISVAIIGGKGYSKNLWDPELYNLPNIDFYGFHDYMFENKPSNGKTRNRNSLNRFSSVNALSIGYQNDSISYPGYQNKLYIYDEFGHYLAIPKPSGKDDRVDPTVDFNNCADFMFKQDLWFTFSVGCAVSGLDWWNHDQSPRQEMWAKYFPAVINFASSIDFEAVDYTTVREIKGIDMIAQRWPTTEKEIKRSNSKPYKKDDLLEAYTQVSSDQAQAFGWMTNRSVHWYNMKEEYPCLNKLVNGTEPYSIPYLYPPMDDDKPETPLDIPEDTYYIKVFHLLKRTKYEIQFYNTLNGTILTTQIARSNGNGILKIYAPDLKVKDNPDVAYKILVSGATWK